METLSITSPTRQKSFHVFKIFFGVPHMSPCVPSTTQLVSIIFIQQLEFSFYA